MSLSLNNSTIIPLQNGQSFTGIEYDNILDFAEINIAIKCDTGFDLTLIYSQDKISVDYLTKETILFSEDTHFIKVSVKDRYFKLKIDATDGNMSFLNVQTIYKSSVTYSSDSNANQDIINIYNILNSKGSQQLWNNVNTGVNGTSAVCNLSTKNIKNLTFMGNCNGATLLTVQFSSDNANWYDSQYSYNLVSAGNLGFSLLSCPNFVRIKSSNDVVASIVLNFN